MFAELRSRNACPVKTLDWYRLPQLFRLGQTLFGNAMMNTKSRTRMTMDQEVRHACGVWQEKYFCGSKCGPRQQEVCVDLLEKALAEVARPGDRLEGSPIPLLIWKIRQTINSEWADAALKQVVATTTIDLASIFKGLKE
jgi:hypothetical protein